MLGRGVACEGCHNHIAELALDSVNMPIGTSEKSEPECRQHRVNDWNENQIAGSDVFGKGEL